MAQEFLPKDQKIHEVLFRMCLALEVSVLPVRISEGSPLPIGKPWLGISENLSNTPGTCQTASSDRTSSTSTSDACFRSEGTRFATRSVDESGPPSSGVGPLASTPTIFESQEPKPTPTIFEMEVGQEP